MLRAINIVHRKKKNKGEINLKKKKKKRIQL